MENINDEINKIEIDGKAVNSKELYELINKEYSEGKLQYEINIKGEKFIFKIIKNFGKYYELEFDSEKISFDEKIIDFFIDNMEYHFKIYCYKNLNLILKKYKFLNPIIHQNNNQIKLNMEINNEFFKSLQYKSIIEEISLNYKNYLVTAEDYQSEEKIKLSNLSKLRKNEEAITIDKLGKYAKNYLKGIGDKENLFFLENELMLDFESHTRYFTEYPAIFNFLTGGEKSGKTFTLLYLNIIECKEKYRIYFNDKYMTELELQDKTDEMLKIFFYEISKIFQSYEDYENFSITFLENIKEILDKIKFKELISKFIDELDLFIQNNRKNYKKMMILLDDYELDEENPENFKINNNFITKLYNKRKNNPIIQFSFISRINDNYMKKCILFALDLKKRRATTGLTKNDENKDIVYYPFIFFNSCLMDPKDCSQYQNEICEMNKKKLKIPNNYLKEINYSLFHINNIKNECENNFQIVEQKSKEYVNKLENDYYKFVNDYFIREKGSFIYNIDKLKQLHTLVNENFIEYKDLIEILNCLPIKFLHFYSCYQPDKNIEERKLLKYKALYIYDFYRTSIDKFLASHEDINYENDKNIKPGKKGDSLEEKVTKSIESNYFDNFRPDKIIEIKSIYNLSLFNVFEEEEEKTKYKYEINQIEQAFIQGYNLIMIKQTNTSAKRYDLAFLQKYKNGKYQFILIQITRNKGKTDLEQYHDVNSDCYKFANFFSIFDNIEVKRYHFLFIIQGNCKTNQKTMLSFLIENRINYIKFNLDIENNNPIFTDSNGKMIKTLVFNDRSFTAVELIKPSKDDGDDETSSEYSLLGQKRQKQSKISQTKYIFGITIYQKIKSILKCEKFELCKQNCYLKENEYFYVYYKKGEDKNKIYYLKYIKNGKIKLQIIKKTKNLKNKEEDEEKEKEEEQNISEEELKETESKCFKVIKK